MTFDEFKKIPFRACGHLSMEHEHALTYTSSDNRFGFCVHTPYKDGEPKGRVYIHYRIGQNVYKTKAAFIKALEAL